MENVGHEDDEINMSQGSGQRQMEVNGKASKSEFQEEAKMEDPQEQQHREGFNPEGEGEEMPPQYHEYKEAMMEQIHMQDQAIPTQ